MKRIFFFLFINLLCIHFAFSQLRSFDDIFPGLNQVYKSAAFSDSGYVKSSRKTNPSDLICTSRLSTGLDPQILNSVPSKNPGYLVESINVIPANPSGISLLDIYNALGNISALKGKLYNSATKKQEVPLFEDATRILSEKQTTAIPDPPPSRTLPSAETVYLRLKDSNFGNSYYRGEIKLYQNGLRYYMSNFKSLTYLLIPVIKEGNFTAQLYIEPITEGILIYSISGAEISDFYASKISMDSAIRKRLAVIVSWAADGITGQKK